MPPRHLLTFCLTKSCRPKQIRVCPVPISCALVQALPAMVRVKNRYLVVNYLYPDATASSSKDALPGALQFHQPTPDEFHPGKLVGAIQAGVAELFGDYGAGMVSTSLKSSCACAIPIDNLLTRIQSTTIRPRPQPPSSVVRRHTTTWYGRRSRS